jgi:hypothetical protein
MTKPPKKRRTRTPSDISQEINLPDRPDPRRLHAAADRLNEVLVDFEKALAQLKLGVSASVTLEDDPSQGWSKELVFGKIGGAFKLAVFAGPYDEQTPTPITNTSRETRLEAVDALPKLYKKLLEAFEAEIVEVNESVAAVEKLAQVIREKAGLAKGTE